MSRIAKSFECTKSTHYRMQFLVISYNLIFSDGFHHAKAHFSSLFHKTPATVHHRQTYGGFQFSPANTLPFPAFFRCNCNRPPSLLHFAISRPVSFIIFASQFKNGHLITASVHIRSFSAGNLSVRPQNAENLVSFLANPSPVGYNRRNPPQQTHPAAAAALYIIYKGESPCLTMII